MHNSLPSATRTKTGVYAVLMIPGGNKQSFMQQPYLSTSYTELWMNAGTYKKSMFIPLQSSLLLDILDTQLLLPSHAITDCDTTSLNSGHSKETACKVFM